MGTRGVNPGPGSGWGVRLARRVCRSRFRSARRGIRSCRVVRRARAEAGVVADWVAVLPSDDLLSLAWLASR